MTNNTGIENSIFVDTFDEETVTYSSEDLMKLLEELASQSNPDDDTVEYQFSPDVLSSLMATDEF